MTDPIDFPETLDSIDLAALPPSLALTRRVDRKYVVPTGAISELLDDLAAGLVAVEVDGSRWQRYRTVYFDTPDRRILHDSLNRRRRRSKIRTREYLQSDAAFVEVKSRSARRGTVKLRSAVDPDTVGKLELGDAPDAGWTEFIHLHTQTDLSDGSLEAAMIVRFTRVTLIDRGETLRCTIDIDVRSETSGGSVALADHAVVETKTTGRPSSVDRWLWRRGLRPRSFSKYVSSWIAADHELSARRYARSASLLTYRRR